MKNAHTFPKQKLLNLLFFTKKSIKIYKKTRFFDKNRFFFFPKFFGGFSGFRSDTVCEILVGIKFIKKVTKNMQKMTIFVDFLSIFAKKCTHGGLQRNAQNGKKTSKKHKKNIKKHVFFNKK